MSFLQMRKRADERWERHCSRCGLCCYERTRTAGGLRIDLSRPCPYLDTSSGRCKVYHRRFAAESYCRKVNLLHALFGRRMPLTCGYVRRFRRWMHE